MEAKILNLLKENSRISYEDIATRLNLSSSEVEAIISNLEQQNVICGYTTIVDDNAIDGNKTVKAIIEVRVTPQREGGFDKVAKKIARFDEVRELALVSGSYDLLLTIEGDSLQEIASFVSAKLSTIDGVLSTATAFQLKKYKEAGKLIANEDYYERLKVCP